MSQIVSVHSAIEEADPDHVIVTLYRSDDGQIRGWYVGPPSFNADIPMSWHTSPDDRLLAPVAIVRAMGIAQKLGLRLSLVDPDGLWNHLK